MILIVGLGNPGTKYIKTRHNIGFRVIDEFRKEQGFPRFIIEKKFQAAISKGNIDDEKIILAKPQTFMNNSGKAIKALIFNSQFSIFNKFSMNKFSNLIVVHDDIDLPLGKIKIVKNRGSAGHRGVKSVIKELGTKDFARFRIGISSTSRIMNYELGITNKELDKFVLKKFTKDEEKIVKQVIKKAGEALKIALTQGPEKAMAEFN